MLEPAHANLGMVRPLNTEALAPSRRPDAFFVSFISAGLKINRKVPPWAHRGHTSPVELSLCDVL